MGPRVVDGIYMAQQQGSIVAMIDDVDAMVNNPRKGHENDQVWQVRTNLGLKFERPGDGDAQITALIYGRLKA